jgi:hypothetical protein
MKTLCVMYQFQATIFVRKPIVNPSMNLSLDLDIKELALVIAVQKQDPSLFTPEFLSYSGIIPQGWELSRQPVRTQQAAQVSYQDGISIVAYPDRTVFVEALSDKSEESIELPSIARRYSEVLQNMDFRAVGVNFRGHVLFPTPEQSAHHFLCSKLLSPGPWQTIGTAPMKAGLNLAYTLERNTLNLSVQEAMLQLPEQERVSVVLFTANFETPLKGDTASECVGLLQNALGQWRNDLAVYKQTVEQFLQVQSRSSIAIPAMAI